MRFGYEVVFVLINYKAVYIWLPMTVFQFLSYQTATNVSEYNVTALMHEIMTGKKYVAPKIDEKKAKHGKATLHEVKEEEDDEKEVEELKSAEEREVNNTKRETQGKWSKIIGFY